MTPSSAVALVTAARTKGPAHHECMWAVLSEAADAADLVTLACDIAALCSAAIDTLAARFDIDPGVILQALGQAMAEYRPEENHP